MNQKKVISALMGMLIFAFGVTERTVFAQSDQGVAGDGVPTTVPENIDAVLFYCPPNRLTLKEVEEQWEQIRGREFVIQKMGTVRHEKVLEFLYRVAIVDPTLYKKDPYPKKTYGEAAVQSMARTGHPALTEKLALILHAPFTGIPAEEVRKIKGKAAQMLLSYNSTDKKLVFAVLDKNAQEGYVLCPYPYPKYGYDNARGKDWKDSPTEPEARRLLHKWLALENRIARLEAALCAARAGISDIRIRELAEAEVGDGQTPPKHRSREWRLAEDILYALRGHGDLKATEKYERIRIERAVMDVSVGDPEADKRTRETFEREFKKDWKKK